MAEPRVACLGEAMIELSLDDSRPDTAAVGVAGDTYNTAVYLKRCLPEARVAYVTKVGADRLSQRIVDAVERHGLDSALVLVSPDNPPGLYAIMTDDAGERSFMYWRSTSAARALFSPPGLELDRLAGVDLLYFSAISLAILPEWHRTLLLDWLPRYRAAGGRVAFDSNYRPALWPDAVTARETVAAAWRQTDIALPSVDDEQALFGDADEAAVLERLRGYGIRSGALKRGAKGPRALDGTPGGPFPQAPRVVDSTAAGDSFNAGYLGARLSGAPEAECLAAGHALAARVIGVRGAIMPADG